MSEKYVNKSDGKFNHGKWIRENMSVMKNQDIKSQGNSLAYRFTEPQQAAVEKFLRKNTELYGRKLWKLEDHRGRTSTV